MNTSATTAAQHLRQILGPNVQVIPKAGPGGVYLEAQIPAGSHLGCRIPGSVDGFPVRIGRVGRGPGMGPRRQRIGRGRQSFSGPYPAGTRYGLLRRGNLR